MPAKARHDLVAKLKNEGSIRTLRVESAFLKVPREIFVPEKYKKHAHEDQPLPIEGGQTISQPTIVAEMTEILRVKPGQKILEIGSGSGYQAAIIAEIIGKKGSLITVERNEELLEFARKNLETAGYADVKLFLGDGSLGYEKEAPYDRIIVTAACPEVPKPLIAQLKLNGVIVAPVGNKYKQRLIVILNKKEGLERIERGECAFVPLIGKYGFDG